MKHKHYKHLFFDLDRTLWDFESSALHTFERMYESHKLENLGIATLESLYQTYNEHNDKLWDEYRNGTLQKEILRDLRFQNTLKAFDIEDENLARALSTDYLYYSPRTVYLFPGTIEILELLKPKYKLYLITNGFDEVQHIKIKEAGIAGFFEKMITSEAAGAKKPDPIIFDYAMQQCNTLAADSLMIGDDLPVDILGAQAFGMDQVYFNPQKLEHTERPTYEISSLLQLKDILI